MVLGRFWEVRISPHKVLGSLENPMSSSSTLVPPCYYIWFNGLLFHPKKFPAPVESSVEFPVRLGKEALLLPGQLGATPWLLCFACFFGLSTKPFGLIPLKTVCHWLQTDGTFIVASRWAGFKNDQRKHPCDVQQKCRKWTNFRKVVGQLYIIPMKPKNNGFIWFG